MLSLVRDDAGCWSSHTQACPSLRCLSPSVHEDQTPTTVSAGRTKGPGHALLSLRPCTAWRHQILPSTHQLLAQALSLTTVSGVGQCLSKNPVCTQQLNACPTRSLPFMGGMEGVDSRPRHMVEALGETMGSPCWPRTPSQLSPSPASLPPAFSHQESKFSSGALPGGPSPCRFLSLLPDPGSVSEESSCLAPRNAIPLIRLKHTSLLQHRFIALIYCCFSAATKRMRRPPPLSLSISSMPGNNC